MAPTERDLDDEIRGHLALSIKEAVERGDDPEEARRRAIAELGYVGNVRESVRRVWYRAFFDTLEDLRRDSRFALRVLRKSPAFTLVAIVTLAVAIGANAIVFGVMNGLVLRPLDVPQPETLYGIEHANEHSMYESYPDYRDLRDRNRSFDGLAAFSISQVGIDTGDRAVRVWVFDATGNYFDVLKLQPHLGRFFHATDERGPNSAPFIVLGYDYWQKHFDGDPAAVGRPVRLNGRPFTIIGVAPKGFHGTLSFGVADLYVPFVNLEQIDGRNLLEARATQTLFMTLGHLKPGVTTAQAAADLNAIGEYLDKTYPNERGATSFTLARPGLYGNYLGQPMRAFFSALMALVVLVLLGACANLGGLFAARASDRSREVAVRLSLGASRVRVLRQLLTEALIISMAGGALGLWGSAAALRALSSWQPMPRWPISVPVSPDATTYVFAVVLGVFSGLLFGLIPVRQVMRTDPYRIIKAGPEPLGGTRLAFRDVLLVMQVAVCAILVTASLVALRGFERARSARLGFEPGNTLLADTDLAMSGYTNEAIAPMQKRLIETVAAIPGVTSVAAIGRPPLAAAGFLSYLYARDATDFRPAKALVTAERFQISPEYFEASRTRLLAGRPFSWHDDDHAPRVAILNAHAARQLYGSNDAALGREFRLRDRTLVRVVGVAEDGKYQNLAEDLRPAVFMPLQQMPMSETWLVVRAADDPGPLSPAVRAAVRRLDPGLPLYVESWSRQLDFALFPSRMATIALAIMGGIGVLLAVTGVFGLSAYSVSKRLKELGIRIALGATRADIVRVALGRPFRLLTSGAVAGLVLGVLASRVLASIVYEASPRDPVVLTGAVLVMVALGLGATWVPARRALSADPLLLLRQE